MVLIFGIRIKIRILLTILGIIWLIGSVIWAFIYVRKIHQMHKNVTERKKMSA